MPRSSTSAAPSRPTSGPAQTRADLSLLRPDLVAGYDAELPGARAAILARLLGAVDRERLPGLTSRRAGEAHFADGAVLRFPDAAAAMFAPGEPGLAVSMLRRADVTTEHGSTLPGADEPSLTAATGRGAGEQGPTDSTWRGADGSRLADSATRRADGSSSAARGADESRWAELGGADRDGLRAVDDPGTLVRLLWPRSALAAEIDNSVANLALARANRAARSTLDPGNLGEAEQLVVDGHPLHPCTRTRGGMTVADVLAYAPEHAPVIRLRRLTVPEDRWYGTGEPVLYAHPWQADRLRANYPWLTDDGETGPARPLMSLRTVAPIHGGPHVKTAIDVQMTSAVRTVSPAAVHNGPILSQLLRNNLLAGLPIDILAETDAGAVIVDGQPQRHLAYLRREAPTLSEGETVLPMAMLSAAPMRLMRFHDAYEMMAHLGTVLFAPLVAVLARGVALEAHGQNTLVVLRDGRPRRILYRDLGGVRVHRRLAVDLHGDLPTDDPQVLRTKLAAAAFGTVASELISHCEADEQKMWHILAAAIRKTGTPDVKHLLTDPLPVKATTAMRLAGDPLEDQWALRDNPMAA